MIHKMYLWLKTS